MKRKKNDNEYEKQTNFKSKKTKIKVILKVQS